MLTLSIIIINATIRFTIFIKVEEISESYCTIIPTAADVTFFFLVYFRKSSPLK